MSSMTDGQLGQGWLFHDRFGFAYDRIPPSLAFEAYGKALMMCATGDGTLQPEERRWVVGYFAAFDSPAEVTNALKTFDEKGDPGATIAMGDTVANEARQWLIWDALSACAADGELKPGELERIRAMAGQVGVAADVVQQIEDLFREERALHRRKLELLWAGRIPEDYAGEEL